MRRYGRRGLGGAGRGWHPLAFVGGWLELPNVMLVVSRRDRTCPHSSLVTSTPSAPILDGAPTRHSSLVTRHCRDERLRKRVKAEWESSPRPGRNSPTRRAEIPPRQPRRARCRAETEHEQHEELCHGVFGRFERSGILPGGTASSRGIQDAMNMTAGQQVHTRRLVVSSAALASIREHGKTTYPFECCGALVGAGDALDQAWLLANTSVENQERRFLVSPAEYRDLERRVSEAGRQLLGFYHSHPDHPAQPSAHDLAAAWPGFVYLILSVRHGAPAKLTGWELRDDRSRFDEVEVVER